MIMLNTLPWFWQALSFLSHWGVKETGELGWRTGSSPVLFWGESTGRRSQRQPHLLPVDFLPDPWNQLSRWTCLPTQPECAGKLEWLPGSPPEVPPCPREGEPGRGRDSEPTAAPTPGGPRSPLREEHTVQRSHLSCRPQTSECWHSDEGAVFQDRGRPGPTQVSSPSVDRIGSGLNVLIVEAPGHV